MELPVDDEEVELKEDVGVANTNQAGFQIPPPPHGTPVPASPEPEEKWVLIYIIFQLLCI